MHSLWLEWQADIIKIWSEIGNWHYCLKRRINNWILSVVGILLCAKKNEHRAYMAVFLHIFWTDQWYCLRFWAMHTAKTWLNLIGKWHYWLDMGYCGYINGLCVSTSALTTEMCKWTSSLLSTNTVAVATVIPNQIQDISCLSEPSAAWRYSNLWSPSPWCQVSSCPGTQAQLCFGDHNKDPWQNEYW